ncbi:MAG: DUF3035 domain-containing protein [Parvularcula sp.]|jgi:hypothetical protein|nr:DUF3035 domain-containing protein [Parvularcula sp.]
MRKFLLLTASVALVAACSSSQGRPGSVKAGTPDEFAILTKPPLTVPPDYALRPPKPGETRPAELSTSQRTQQLLMGDTDYEPPSNGELAFIQDAGALNVDPSIRAILSAENGGRAEKSDSLANRLIFWNVNADGSIDDSRAPLVVEDRDAWMEQRRESIERVTGEGASVTIAEDKRGTLRLPGVK